MREDDVIREIRGKMSLHEYYQHNLFFGKSSSPVDNHTISLVEVIFQLLNHLGLEIKYTPEKTELVKSEVNK